MRVYSGADTTGTLVRPTVKPTTAPADVRDARDARDAREGRTDTPATSVMDVALCAPKGAGREPMCTACGVVWAYNEDGLCVGCILRQKIVMGAVRGAQWRDTAERLGLDPAVVHLAAPEPAQPVRQTAPGTSHPARRLETYTRVAVGIYRIQRPGGTVRYRADAPTGRQHSKTLGRFDTQQEAQQARDAYLAQMAQEREGRGARGERGEGAA